MERVNRLIDGHGRHIHKLRVSITDACNFRCLYCMPENALFKPKSRLLTAAEIREICAGLVELGIDEIRITGGEPTVREEFEEIVLALSALPLKKLGITSNGYLLESKLSFLSETNCRHLNVSLDSLNDKTFAGVTKTRTFNRVHRAVLKARDMGFNVKVNAVLLKGENDGELLDFVDFSAREGITVRFLELMKIGPMYGENASKFMAAREAIDRIEVRESLRRVPAPADSTAYYFDTASGARIGFIASESEPFCGSCSRLRLSDTGVLRSCLMSCAGLSLRGKPRAQYPELLRAVMAMKPAERIHHVDQPMHEIGG